MTKQGIIYFKWFEAPTLPHTACYTTLLSLRSCAPFMLYHYWWIVYMRVYIVLFFLCVCLRLRWWEMMMMLWMVFYVFGLMCVVASQSFISNLWNLKSQSQSLFDFLFFPYFSPTSLNICLCIVSEFLYMCVLLYSYIVAINNSILWLVVVSIIIIISNNIYKLDFWIFD